MFYINKSVNESNLNFDIILVNKKKWYSYGLIDTGMKKALIMTYSIECEEQFEHFTKFGPTFMKAGCWALFCTTLPTQLNNTIAYSSIQECTQRIYFWVVSVGIMPLVCHCLRHISSRCQSKAKAKPISCSTDFCGRRFLNDFSSHV